MLDQEILETTPKEPEEEHKSEPTPSLEEQFNEMKDRWLRALAENENLRRRAQKEKEDATRFGLTQFARDVVGLCDNFERALQSIPSESVPEELQSFTQGVELIAKEFVKILERHGVKVINAHGVKFDPNLHQAMIEIEHDTIPSGCVVDVLQEGYLIQDRLLRPAMVSVSKGPATEKENG